MTTYLECYHLAVKARDFEHTRYLQAIQSLCKISRELGLGEPGHTEEIILEIKRLRGLRCAAIINNYMKESGVVSGDEEVDAGLQRANDLAEENQKLKEENQKLLSRLSVARSTVPPRF